MCLPFLSFVPTQLVRENATNEQYPPFARTTTEKIVTLFFFFYRLSSPQREECGEPRSPRVFGSGRYHKGRSIYLWGPRSHTKRQPSYSLFFFSKLFDPNRLPLSQSISLQQKLWLICQIKAQVLLRHGGPVSSKCPGPFHC